MLTAAIVAQDTSVAFLQSDGSIDPDITATVTGTQDVTYAVPGNFYPDAYVAVVLDVTVASGAAPELRGVQISSAGTQNSLPATINVV